MREKGYYWVKIDGQWMIGEFKGESWYFCDPMLDYPGGHDSEDLEEIDERRIERQEPTEHGPYLLTEEELKKLKMPLPKKD